MSGTDRLIQCTLKKHKDKERHRKLQIRPLYVSVPKLMQFSCYIKITVYSKYSMACITLFISYKP